MATGPPGDGVLVRCDIYFDRSRFGAAGRGVELLHRQFVFAFDHDLLLGIYDLVVHVGRYKDIGERPIAPQLELSSFDGRQTLTDQWRIEDNPCAFFR